MRRLFFLLAVSGIFMSGLFANLALANTAIAVVDFDNGKVCTPQEAVAMTDLFRNQLVQSEKADIVDRKHMDAVITEYKFQMSDWANPSKIKQIGKRIGADYLMTGKFDKLGENPYLLVNMLDVETGKILYSSRLNMTDWEEFDYKVEGFAGEFIKKLPAPAASKNIFTGKWSAVISHNNIMDSYSFIFTDTNRCTVKVESISDDKELTAEGQGTYSYDSNSSIFKITVVLKNSKIPHLKNIQWSSVIALENSNRSFNMLVKPENNKNNQVRATFTKETK